MKRSLLGLLLLLGGAVCSTQAQTLEERVLRLEQENDELKLKLDAVSSQMEQFEFRDVIPAVGESRFGMGPAASKVYAKDQGFSIGGYGEGIYRNVRSGDGRDSADFVRAILYTGYKFDDQWVFNSEIEVEHASTGETGSVSVEFAYVEHLISDELNVRAGLLLAPLGFINELHEPTTFYGPARPETERRIIPSTWRENGVGIHGSVGDVNYKLFLMNGFDGGDFTASGLRGGRQKGSRAKAEDLAIAARVDWNLHSGVIAGVSAYYGNSGQNQDGLGDTTTTILEAHAEGRWRGLRVRGLYAMATVDDTEELFAATGEVVGEEMVGGYLEAGYDVMEFIDDETAQQLIPFVRYEVLDTHDKVATGLTRDREQDETVVSVGINWFPIDQLVFKAAYQGFERGDDRIELGMGYVF